MEAVSDSPGLADFVVGIVVSILDLLNGQLKFLGIKFENMSITEALSEIKVLFLFRFFFIS